MFSMSESNMQASWAVALHLVLRVWDLEMGERCRAGTRVLDSDSEGPSLKIRNLQGALQFWLSPPILCPSSWQRRPERARSLLRCNTLSINCWFHVFFYRAGLLQSSLGAEI